MIFIKDGVHYWCNFEVDNQGLFICSKCGEIRMFYRILNQYGRTWIICPGCGKEIIRNK